MKKHTTDGWYGLSYGRRKKAHYWRSSDTRYYVQSNCGMDVLADHMCSPDGLPKCKTCVKGERNGR